MATEGDRRPNLVELYDRYDREQILRYWGLGIGGVVTVGMGALTLANTNLSGEWVGGVYRSNVEVLQKYYTVNLPAVLAVYGTEFGVGFLAWRRSEVRKRELALQIAQAEGRIADETNDKRVKCTAALASTLVYGVQFKSTLVNNLINTYVRPLWEVGFFNVSPEGRKLATFASFDEGVNYLLVDEHERTGIAVAALNLGRARWELIRNGHGSSHLRGYSYAMLSEINRRLGEPLP